MLHNGFRLADQRQAFAGIYLPVDLIRQRLKVLIVPERIVLRTIFAVPGIEIVRRIEQGRHDGSDRQVVVAALGVVEPHRFNNRAQIALDIERLLQHSLDGLRPEFEGRNVANQVIQPLDALAVTRRRH